MVRLDYFWNFFSRLFRLFYVVCVCVLERLRLAVWVFVLEEYIISLKLFFIFILLIFIYGWFVCVEVWLFCLVVCVWMLVREKLNIFMKLFVWVERFWYRSFFIVWVWMLVSEKSFMKLDFFVEFRDRFGKVCVLMLLNVKELKFGFMEVCVFMLFVYVSMLFILTVWVWVFVDILVDFVFLLDIWNKIFILVVEFCVCIWFFICLGLFKFLYCESKNFSKLVSNVCIFMLCNLLLLEVFRFRVLFVWEIWGDFGIRVLCFFENDVIIEFVFFLFCFGCFVILRIGFVFEFEKGFFLGVVILVLNLIDLELFFILVFFVFVFFEFCLFLFVMFFESCVFLFFLVCDMEFIRKNIFVCVVCVVEFLLIFISEICLKLFIWYMEFILEVLGFEVWDIEFVLGLLNKDFFFFFCLLVFLLSVWVFVVYFFFF